MSGEREVEFIMPLAYKDPSHPWHKEAMELIESGRAAWSEYAATTSWASQEAIAEIFKRGGEPIPNRKERRRLEAKRRRQP